MSFMFQTILWLHQYSSWHTGEGADSIAIFFWLQCQSVWWTTAQTCPVTELAETEGALEHKPPDTACTLLGG